MIVIVDKNIQDMDKKGRYNSFYFRSSLSDIKLFKKIYFENSFINEVKANKDYASNSKKIFFLSVEDIQTLINLTNREFKRDKRVSSILKSATPLSFFLNQDSLSKIDYYTDKFIKDNDIIGVSQQLFRKLHYSKDITKEALYLLESSQKSPKNSIILNVNRHVSEVTNELLSIIKENNRVIINAPTGSGKSHFVLDVLPKYFKKITSITPLRMLTNEHAQNPNFVNFSIADNENALLADLSNPYIAMTTDVLVNLDEKYPEISKKRLNESILNVFDEQHLIESSKGFRHKVLKSNRLLKDANKSLLYLSGTPSYNKNENIQSVVIKTPLLYKIKYFNNIFDSLDKLKNSINKHLEKGSVLFYCATKLKVNEVVNALPFKNVCTITSEQTTYNGNVITDINQIPNEDKVLYISTTRITTGVNINGLKAIYQYGTTYDTTTLFQLMTRLRNSGDFYYIKAKFENNQMSNFTDTAIGLTEYFESLKLESIQKDFYSKEFQALIKSRNIVLADNTPKGFLKSYYRVLNVMDGLGIGKWNLDRSDFIYKVKKMDREAILKAFISSDNIALKRDTDKAIVNFISGENIELIKGIYNSSFDIQLQDIPSFNTGLEIITDKDKSVKVEKNREKKNELDTFRKNVYEKFEYITPKLLKKAFTVEELKILSDTNINHEAIKAYIREDDRLTALRCYFTSKKDIFNAILELMVINNSSHIDIKSIDNILSQKFSNSSKRTKNPHSQFLKELFNNGFFDGSGLEYKDRINEGKTAYYNVVKVKNEYKKEFEVLTSKKQRELFIKSLIRQGKVVVEDINTTEVTTITTPTSIPIITPTERYINELQGVNNNRNKPIPIDKVPKDYLNLTNKRVRYKNFNNIMNL